MGLEAERKAEAESAQGSAAEPAFGGLPVAKSKSLSSQTMAAPKGAVIRLSGLCRT